MLPATKTYSALKTPAEGQAVKDCWRREESRGQARPSFLQLVFGFHLPGDEWLLSRKQLLPGAKAKDTTHTVLAVHGPMSKEAGGSQVLNRKGGGSAHNPMQTGDWLLQEAADTISFHDFNTLKSSWRGYQVQDCIYLPCSLSLEMSPYSLCWLFCSGRITELHRVTEW